MSSGKILKLNSQQLNWVKNYVSLSFLHKFGSEEGYKYFCDAVTSTKQMSSCGGSSRSKEAYATYLLNAPVYVSKSKGWGATITTSAWDAIKATTGWITGRGSSTSTDEGYVDLLSIAKTEYDKLDNYTKAAMTSKIASAAKNLGSARKGCIFPTPEFGNYTVEQLRDLARLYGVSLGSARSKIEMCAVLEEKMGSTTKGKDILKGYFGETTIPLGDMIIDNDDDEYEKTYFKESDYKSRPTTSDVYGKGWGDVEGSLGEGELPKYRRASRHTGEFSVKSDPAYLGSSAPVDERDLVLF